MEENKENIETNTVQTEMNEVAETTNLDNSTNVTTNNNRNNKKYVIIFAILVVLVIALLFVFKDNLFGKKEEPTDGNKVENTNVVDNNETDNNNNNEEVDEPINTEPHTNNKEYLKPSDIENGEEVAEVIELINYLNGKGVNESGNDKRTSACYLLAAYPRVKANEDFFNNQNQVLAYECLHNLDFTMIKDSAVQGTVVLSKEEYDKFKKYFSANLDTYDEVANNYSYMTGDPGEYGEILKKNAEEYLGKNYYYGYSVGDGFGATGFNYNIKKINKVSDGKYEVIITSSHYNLDTKVNETLEGTLTLEKVDNYFKYSSLIFKVI